MVQLAESGTRNHAPDLTKALVLAKSFRSRCEAKPNSAGFLYLPRQRAIVDQLVADSGNPPHTGKGLSPDQYAAPSRSRSAVPRREIDPSRRIQFEKEKH